jgi:hypothetical protein
MQSNEKIKLGKRQVFQNVLNFKYIFIFIFILNIGCLERSSSQYDLLNKNHYAELIKKEKHPDFVLDVIDGWHNSNYRDTVLKRFVSYKKFREKILFEIGNPNEGIYYTLEVIIDKKGTVLFCRDENILKQELLIATNKIDDTYKEIVNSSNEKYTLDPNVIICTKVNKEIKIDIRYGLSSDILNKISKFH